MEGDRKEKGIKMKKKIFVGDMVYEAELKDKGDGKYLILLNGKEYNVDIKSRIFNGHRSILVNNNSFDIYCEYVDEGKYNIHWDGKIIPVSFHHPEEEEKLPEGEIFIKASMPGLVVKVNVDKGEEVKKGQPLAILEAMKMQNEIKTPDDGKVIEVFVKEGQTVSLDDKMFVIKI